MLLLFFVSTLKTLEQCYFNPLTKTRESRKYTIRFIQKTVHFYLSRITSLSAFPTIKGDVKRDDSRLRFLAQHSVEMLKQYCNYSKQCCNAVLR